MLLPSQVAAMGFSLASVLCWGTSDFLGGYASRTANAFLITLIAHGSGLALVTTVASLSHSPWPSNTSLLWGLAAGASGGAALAIFYRALSTGRMGLTAPVAAVLSAAIPVVFGIAMDGMPHSVQIAGFICAGAGIWLISRSEDGNSPQGIGMAMLAGLGFAGFYLGIRQAGEGSALWTAAASRFSAFVVTAVIVLAARAWSPLNRSSAAWAVLAGFLDVSGTVCFIHASQAGRLDAAVVLASLYPVVTVLLARLVLKEQFTRWKLAGMLAALAAVPLIAM